MTSHPKRQPDIKTAEGLGGTNISGAQDPKAQTNALETNISELKPSDPEWVHRSRQEEVPKYMEHAAQGVGYDPGSAAVVMVEGEDVSKGREASVTGASVSNVTPKSHALGGKGDPEALGATGVTAGDVKQSPMSS